MNGWTNRISLCVPDPRGPLQSAFEESHACLKSGSGGCWHWESSVADRSNSVADTVNRQTASINPARAARRNCRITAGGHAPAGHRPMGHPPGGAHQHFDSRFSHNQYYYDHGYAVHRPPPGAFGELHDRDGGRYWHHRGDWYRYRGGWYRWWGGAWIVWGPPIGLFVPVLPPYLQKRSDYFRAEASCLEGRGYTVKSACGRTSDPWHL